MQQSGRLYNEKENTQHTLGLAICLSILPAAAFAADIASGDGWTLDESGCLHITGPVENQTVIQDLTPWSACKSQIKTAVAESGAAVDNGCKLFYGCTALTSADLSELDVSAVTNMGSMFEGCSSLASLDLSGFNTANVTDMSSMFYNCSSLASLDLSGFNTEKATNFASMFSGYSALAEIGTNPALLAKTAEQLISICSVWIGKADGTAYTDADALKAITDKVTLVKCGAVYLSSRDESGLSITFRNTMAADVCIAVAEYDGDGRMLCCSFLQPSATSAGSVVPAELPAEAAQLVRIFVLSSEMEPLDRSLELLLN